MKKLLYLFLTVLIVSCSGEDNNNGGDNNQSSCNGDNPVYLADNGITIKACDFASVGDTGVVNGVTYTVVDEAMLRNMAANGEDVTKVATTKVTDMVLMFVSTPFNQPIGNWDVSNVTDMIGIFADTPFNQPIGNWDVSNVTLMAAMFSYSAFNQSIGNWDVSSATNMNLMFEVSVFNQDLSSWSVDNVTECNGFSYGATSWTLPQPNFTNCTP